MTSRDSTRSDRATRDWAIDDGVVQFREWGSETAHALPEQPAGSLSLGCAPTCAIRIHDPSGRASRLHAHVLAEQGKWLLRDDLSKNGMWVDGLRRREVVLVPGQEIGIGGVLLIAESRRSIDFRRFLQRMLGWGNVEVVDQALRSARMAAARRATLVLRGDGDLVQIARAIHDHTRGTDRPFIVCDPRRRGESSVRSVASLSTGKAALAEAAGGSLCMRAERPPRDFKELLAMLQAPHSQVQFIVCSEIARDNELYGVKAIDIPSLATREDEIDRIIDEYVADAAVSLRVPHVPFQAVDRAWVRQHAATSIPDIERATRRLVALRASRTLTDAAGRLGMANVSLSRWMGRRPPPKDVGS
jgi:FHA domain